MAVNSLRYKYRLYPNLDQHSLLAQTFGCARVVYNDFIHARRSANQVVESLGLSPEETAEALK